MVVFSLYSAFQYCLIDSLLSWTSYDLGWQVNLNTLKEAQDNGEISTIKDDSLRETLYHLSSIVKIIEDRQNIANEDNNTFFVPFLYKHVNRRNISAYFNEDYRKRIGYSKLEMHEYSNTKTR